MIDNITTQTLKMHAVIISSAPTDGPVPLNARTPTEMSPFKRGIFVYTKAFLGALAKLYQVV